MLENFLHFCGFESVAFISHPSKQQEEDKKRRLQNKLINSYNITTYLYIHKLWNLQKES